MKVLVIDEEVPYPLNSGKRLRTFNLLKNLSPKHDILFICREYEDGEGIYSQALEDIGIKTIVVHHPIRKKVGIKFLFALFFNIFSKYPYTVASHFSNELIKELNIIKQKEKFDVIHCEWTPYAINTMSIHDIPIVVDAHNVEAMIWQRYYEIESNPFKKGYLYLQWKKMLNFEKVTFNKFNKIVAVSQNDKKIISQFVDEDKIRVVDNGVDTDYFSSLGNDEDNFSLIFSGAMDWRPNVDAMFFFLDEIWPNILSSHPICSLTIVGRNPLQVLKDRIKNTTSVTLTGTVDDVRPYIDRSSIFIVPLRVGGGSRLKILEALSMKKPVVSTSIGAEGLDVENGKDIIIADDTGSFTKAIELLFNDSQLRRTLGNAGRTLVEDKYQWKVISDKLEKVWIEVSRSV